jgi:hypothetical protein
MPSPVMGLPVADFFYEVKDMITIDMIEEQENLRPQTIRVSWTEKGSGFVALSTFKNLLRQLIKPNSEHQALVIDEDLDQFHSLFGG